MRSTVKFYFILCSGILVVSSMAHAKKDIEVYVDNNETKEIKNKRHTLRIHGPALKQDLSLQLEEASTNLIITGDSAETIYENVLLLEPSLHVSDSEEKQGEHIKCFKKLSSNEYKCFIQLNPKGTAFENY